MIQPCDVIIDWSKQLSSSHQTVDSQVYRCMSRMSAPAWQLLSPPDWVSLIVSQFMSDLWLCFLFLVTTQLIIIRAGFINSPWYNPLPRESVFYVASSDYFYNLFCISVNFYCPTILNMNLDLGSSQWAVCLYWVGDTCACSLFRFRYNFRRNNFSSAA